MLTMANIMMGHIEMPQLNMPMIPNMMHEGGSQHAHTIGDEGGVELNSKDDEDLGKKPAFQQTVENRCMQSSIF